MGARHAPGVDEVVVAPRNLLLARQLGVRARHGQQRAVVAILGGELHSRCVGLLPLGARQHEDAVRGHHGDDLQGVSSRSG